MNDAVELIVGIEKTYNINNSLLDELISNGILTQNIRYDNDEYIYVTYERLEDYLYAKKLVDDLNEIGKKSFEKKHSDLIHYGDVLEALAIVLPEASQYELFEIFEPNSGNIIKSFCRSLKWRKKTRLEDKVFKYINDTVLRTAGGFETFFEEWIFISAKIGHDLNAEKTVNYILSFAMPERDSLFIPLLDQIYYEEGSAINRLLEWCFMQTNETNALEETIRLVACMLATFLMTSNNLLRDKTTKALVCLLSGRIDVLLTVMDKFKDVDDPYIIERLYAVCFGCVVNETSELQIEKLALFVYNRIFNCENVYPNILLRDYAKNIVNYAKYKVDSEELKALNVQPPYKSSMPKIPSDEEIKKYELDYRSSDFKDYYWSQNAIISSMQVEYDRKGQPGGYGDFGRYTFQSYFSNWDGMDYNDLKNIAIKRIFELGYDVERHGEYDRHIGGGRHRSLSRERIGKKYQWIALYELAAQVADNYDLKVYTGEYGEKKKMKCLGTFEPYIRNIDPTIKIIASQSSSIKKIHSSIYSLPQIDHMSWLSNFNDLPDVEKLIKMTHQNNDYLLLNGWYSWEEEKPLGVQAYQTPQKNIWIQINGYIVKEEHHKKFINIFESSMIDLMGRWAAEPNENSQLYNKEYYWSDGFEFFKDPYISKYIIGK